MTYDWIKKMRCIYTRDNHSAVRKDAILPFVTTQMDLERVVLRKISQKKLRTYDFTHPRRTLPKWNYLPEGGPLIVQASPSR